MSDIKEFKEPKDIKGISTRAFNYFETAIAIGLVLVISILIITSFWQLIVMVSHFFSTGHSPIDNKISQSAFGMIMTILISLELSRTIIYAHHSQSREIIVKTVILVAILAISRQFIVMELDLFSAWTIVALSLSLISMGSVYWILDHVRKNEK